MNTETLRFAGAGPARWIGKGWDSVAKYGVPTPCPSYAQVNRGGAWAVQWFPQGTIFRLVRGGTPDACGAREAVLPDGWAIADLPKPVKVNGLDHGEMEMVYTTICNAMSERCPTLGTGENNEY